MINNEVVATSLLRYRRCNSGVGSAGDDLVPRSCWGAPAASNDISVSERCGERTPDGRAVPTASVWPTYKNFEAGAYDADRYASQLFAPTRLLAWTESLNVALFCALTRESKPTVFVLDPVKLNTYREIAGIVKHFAIG